MLKIMIVDDDYVISERQAIVAIGFLNGSDKEFKMGRENPEPGLTDEKGNVYRYVDGLARVGNSNLRSDGLTLAPKLENDLMLKFRYNDQEINYTDIGSVFTFSLSFEIYNPKNKSISDYKVIFLDIKAQKPKIR